MNKNDSFLKKKSLLSSLKILINSNQNFFESHKFNLVQNLQSPNTAASSSSSSSNTASSLINHLNDNGLIFKLPCWLVNDFILKLKENNNEYDNYLIIQKIVNLLREYFFNLIDYEAKMESSFKKANLANEMIAEEDNNNLNEVSNYANCFVSNLIEGVSNEFNLRQTVLSNLADRNYDDETSKYDSFASNFISDLFNRDKSELISNQQLTIDTSSSDNPRCSYALNKLLNNRRHSADTATESATSINKRLSLINFSNNEVRSVSNENNTNDLSKIYLCNKSVRRNGRYASLTGTHYIGSAKCLCCSGSICQCTNPYDLNKNPILKNSFKINFPSKLTKCKSKVIGYASSDSDLNSLNDSETSFKQYNKVVIKSILKKNNTNKPKKDLTSHNSRPSSANSDLNVVSNKMNSISNSLFLKDLIDDIIKESINDVKLIKKISESNFAEDLVDSIFKDAYLDTSRLNTANKKNQHFCFKCNCVPDDEKDLTCLLTIYCMMIAVGELNLKKNKITIICSHIEQNL